MPCFNAPNVFSYDFWKGLPGFQGSQGGQGGTYTEDCNGSGGNTCFAVTGETKFENGKRSDLTAGRRVSVEMALDGKTAALVKLGATSPQ